MLRQFLFGGAVSTVNICLHALVMTILVQVARNASARSKSQASQHLVLVMVPTVLVLMITHALEVVADVLGLAPRVGVGLVELRDLGVQRFEFLCVRLLLRHDVEPLDLGA